MTDVDLEVESDLEENLTEEDRNEAANVFAKKVEIIGGPPAGPATLEAKDACAWFGYRLVLEGVDLVMPKGKGVKTGNGKGTSKTLAPQPLTQLLWPPRSAKA